MKFSEPYHLILIWITCCAFVPATSIFATEPPEDELHYFPSLSFPEAVVINPNTIYIPFNLAGRLIAVEARVDTFVGTFIVDTGAERLLLNKKYFGRSGPSPDASRVSAIGNTGQVADVEKRWVDTLHWDNLFFKRVQANIVDLTHIEQKKKIKLIGVLGFNVFKDFEVFLDFQLMQIILTRLDRKGFRLDSTAIWEVPYDSLDFKMAGHFIVLKGEVGGQTFKFGLDSGAELNLIDRRVKRKILDQFEIVKRVRMLGAGQNTIEVVAGNLNQVKIGNQFSEQMRTLLTSLSEMSFNFGIRLDGIIGYEFLSSRRTLINYKRKKLFFFAYQKP